MTIYVTIDKAVSGAHVYKHETETENHTRIQRQIFIRVTTGSIDRLLMLDVHGNIECITNGKHDLNMAIWEYVEPTYYDLSLLKNLRIKAAITGDNEWWYDVITARQIGKREYLVRP